GEHDPPPLCPLLCHRVLGPPIWATTAFPALAGTSECRTPSSRASSYRVCWSRPDLVLPSPPAARTAHPPDPRSRSATHPPGSPQPRAAALTPRGPVPGRTTRVRHPRGGMVLERVRPGSSSLRSLAVSLHFAGSRT